MMNAVAAAAAAAAADCCSFADWHWPVLLCVLYLHAEGFVGIMT